MRVLRNIPNYLTIFRILITPIIVLTFYFEGAALSHILGSILFIFAGISDFLDGYIAKKFNLISNFGQMLDPVADKVLISCVIVMLIKTDKVNVIAGLLILSREFIVSGLREFLGQVQVSMPVSRLSKLKTIVQMCSLSLLILGSQASGIRIIDPIGNASLWVAVILTIITGSSYIKSCKALWKN
ncbi:MAG: CDP-diacylglycerol--glycerol-3-phosphate 3-phosphatidyltransferase [Rickettsiaceae bacterium]